jgi:hypothetical protein
MARWQDSGGFGLTPTLPATVEDTYHALRILETMMPGSEQLRTTVKNPHLRTFLSRAEDAESWSLRTAYQYLFSCGLCELQPAPGWLNRFLDEKRKGFHSLRDRYYFMKILKDRHDKPPIDRDDLMKGISTKRWRTARELGMCLYLREGSIEGLETTKEALTRWLQECQNSDGGFGFFPGTTSFIENGHYCLRVLESLGEKPLSLDTAWDFILRCKTSGGGFSRKSGGAPFLYATWHAVAGLAILGKMSGISSPALSRPMRWEGFSTTMQTATCGGYFSRENP